jgi:biotin-dependent carboxylase-like uncharacterized protein
MWAADMAELRVLRVGLFASIQDRGRFGYSNMGLGSAGPADRGSAALANRMVGNSADAALVEVTFGVFEIEATAAVIVAVTGATCDVTVSGPDGSGSRGSAVLEVIGLQAGERLQLGAPSRGLRNYIAVRGGIAVQPVLGSRSWDTLAKLGPEPLVVGGVLPVGTDAQSWPIVDAVAPPLTDEDPPRLDVLCGPRDDWFTADSLTLLVGQDYVVTPDSDRVGMRLGAAVPLRRSIERELPSEGVVTGSLQVPPNGFPVLFLADHPVTGGYPVIAVLSSASIDRAAQLRPGDLVRFGLVGG